MNKDKSLQKQQKKFVILIAGDSDVGKKTIAQNFVSNFSEVKPIERSNFMCYQFEFPYTTDYEEEYTIPAEIRVCQYEVEEDPKLYKDYFKDVLAAFVVTSFDNIASFEK
jgi:septin family protein